MDIPYKSFCWSIGTTSFRTKNFNKTIEEQLVLLNQFWDLPENKNVFWTSNNNVQKRYYDFMQKSGFIVGEASRKDKDAREKTSGLVDIGLLDGNRKLTQAGLALLAIAQKGDFKADNKLGIPNDSFIYLKQLLKCGNLVEGKIVRPFIIVLYLLSIFEYFTIDEYTYLLPLCTNKDTTISMVRKILEFRNKKTTIDEIIIDKLMSMENYQLGLKEFLRNPVNAELICAIGMNRKSRTYDIAYFELYKTLKSVYLNGNKAAAIHALDVIKSIKIGRLWRNYIFKKSTQKNILKNPIAHLNNDALFSKVNNEKEFKGAFFKVMHLLKARATLSDYLDQAVYKNYRCHIIPGWRCKT